MTALGIRATLQAKVFLLRALFLAAVPLMLVPVSRAAAGQDEDAVGAEVLLSSVAEEVQHLPAIAYGQGVHLIVWQEGWNGVGGNAQIKGALVRTVLAEGRQVLKIEKSLVISDAPDHQETPQVAFSGGMFLVVWHDFRNGKDADIFGARVTPEGKMLDAEGIAIVSRPHNQNFPVVCGNGKDFLVVWREVRYGQAYDLMAARIESQTGKVLDEKGVRLANDVALPAVGFTGQHYIVAWLDTQRSRKMQVCRYDPASLNREDREPITLGHSDAFSRPGQLKLVSGDKEVLAVWARGIDPDPWGWGGPGATLAVRINDDGSVPEMAAYNKIRWSPEGRRLYVDKVLPGVLDCARWKDLPGWPQGKPGGFKAAEGGIWPYAYLSAVALPGGKNQYACVWTRRILNGLAPTGRQDLVGVRLHTQPATELLDATPMEIVSGSDATLPSLSAGASGEPLVLVYERRERDGRSVVCGRPIMVRSNE